MIKSMSSTDEVTRLLNEMSAGTESSPERLLELVYDDLRRLAGAYMQNERSDHTLQATALVHEAYMRLIEQHSTDWQNRAHFFGLAAEMMRRILVNHAVKRNAEKRFGNQTKIALDDAISLMVEREVTVSGSLQVLAAAGAVANARAHAAVKAATLD